MNNRNQQTARVQAPAEAPTPTYVNVFTVEESMQSTAACWYYRPTTTIDDAKRYQNALQGRPEPSEG